MDAAAVEAVDAVAAFGPEWVIVIVVCVIIAAVAIKVIPAVEASRKTRLEITRKESEARIEIERERERRKADEERSREKRDRERSEAEGRWSAQNERSIRAQEQSNLAMEAVTKQLEIMNAQIQDSKDNSRIMGQKLEDMSDKVDAIDKRLKNQ